MLINIRTSLENKTVVQDLTKKMNLGTENLVSRIAFAYSISRGTKLDLQKDLQDSKGKEYKDDILFGKYRDYYIAIICQHYQLHKSDQDIGKYIKMHVDHGLGLLKNLFESNQNYAGLDFLIDSIEKGIEVLNEDDLTNDPILLDNQTRKNRIINKTPYDKVIEIPLGKYMTEDGEQDAIMRLNDRNFRANHHLAIAGNSGTGKTFMAKNILKSIWKSSKEKVNFMFIDFKGISEEDVIANSDFFTSTSTTLIKAPDTPFPINPLSFIDNINEKNKKLGINKLVDIIAQYSNLGTVQQQFLKEATKNAFAKKKDGTYPGFSDILQEINSIQKKPSSLTEIMENLGDMELFDGSKIKSSDLFDQNFYFSLGGNLPKNIRLTAVFLIINYIYNSFMNMDEAPIKNDIQGIRYVLLIDEAHVLFNDKKSQELLESILREIRSKGVSIILLSQGIEEFVKEGFDFSSMCATTMLFDIKAKSNVKMIQKFMGLNDKEIIEAKKCFEVMERHGFVASLPEFKNVKLCFS